MKLPRINWPTWILAGLGVGCLHWWAWLNGLHYFPLLLFGVIFCAVAEKYDD